MADLVSARLVYLDEETIYQNLLKAEVTGWGPEIIEYDGKEVLYLFGGDYAYPYSLPADAIDKLSARLNEANRMTWYKNYNERAIEYFEQTGEALNQALAYWESVGDRNLPKPQILPIDGLDDGDDYIAIIGLFHLTGGENRNNSHLFIDLIDGQGNRIYNHTPPLHLFYGWEGMSIEEERNMTPVRIDKPTTEPGANIFISWGQIVYGFHINSVATDRFRGIHTRYPNDGEGNNQGHHSHYIVLQKRKYKGSTEPPPDPEPPDPEPPDPEPDKTTVLAVKKSWLDGLPVDDDGFIRIKV